MTNMLIETRPLGARFAKTLADSASLMRGHGAVARRRTIPNVVGRSIYLDLNARIQLQSMQLVELNKDKARSRRSVRKRRRVRRVDTTPARGALEKKAKCA